MGDPLGGTGDEKRGETRRCVMGENADLLLSPRDDRTHHDHLPFQPDEPAERHAATRPGNTASGDEYAEGSTRKAGAIRPKRAQPGPVNERLEGKTASITGRRRVMASTRRHRRIASGRDGGTSFHRLGCRLQPRGPAEEIRTLTGEDLPGYAGRFRDNMRKSFVCGFLEVAGRRRRRLGFGIRGESARIMQDETGRRLGPLNLAGSGWAQVFDPDDSRDANRSGRLPEPEQRTGGRKLHVGAQGAL